MGQWNCYIHILTRRSGLRMKALLGRAEWGAGSNPILDDITGMLTCHGWSRPTAGCIVWDITNDVIANAVGLGVFCYWDACWEDSLKCKTDMVLNIPAIQSVVPGLQASLGSRISDPTQTHWIWICIHPGPQATHMHIQGSEALPQRLKEPMCRNLTTHVEFQYYFMLTPWCLLLVLSFLIPYLKIRWNQPMEMYPNVKFIAG